MNEITEIKIATSRMQTNKLNSTSISHTKNAPYVFYSKDSEKRWRRKKPLRKIDTSLGWPILVVDDDGNYVMPDSSEEEEDCVDVFGSSACVRKQVRIGTIRKLYNKKSMIHDVGVFAGENFTKGSYLGLYGGTVLTDEEWENERNGQGQFIFVIHHGRQGVVLDGEVGPTNELKHINHSCEPNARMVELFEEDSWYVVVVAIRDINIGDEITHDYGLTTEDPDDPDLKIPCNCGSAKCRKRLFEYREW